MKLRYTAAGLLAALCFAASQASAYTLYPEGKTAASLNDYTEELASLTQSLSLAIAQYTPNADALPDTDIDSDTAPDSDTDIDSDTVSDSDSAQQEEKPDIAAIYGDLLALSQEYHLAVKEQGAQLSSKLIDYDVLLKRLRTAMTRYGRRTAAVKELELLAMTGGIDQSVLSAAKDEVESVYYDIKSILSEISVLKTEIENVTGERLKDSFDFDSVYLITDALTLSPEALSDNVTLSTIYVPVGAEGAVYEKRDPSADLNNAVQAYYQLGSAIRELMTAVSQLKDAEEKQRLGQLSADELLLFTEAREDKFLIAAQAKADFSKALLALDISSGGGLTYGYGTSAEEISSLRRTIGGTGTGLWMVKLTKDGTALCPVSYPAGTLSVSVGDSNRYTYSVYYDGKLIGNAVSGSSCTLNSIEYRDGVNTAQVEFYVNGAVVSRWNISIFTPYGDFVNG